MPFEKATLNDGNEIPTIAFGTGSVNKYHDVWKYVAQAIDAGFTHIDTAQYYGNEESVKKAIQHAGLKREDYYITTKYGGGKIQESVRQSLDKLGVDYVDLYLIHTPRLVDDIPAAWKDFEKIKEDGLAKSIGVSNFSHSELQALVESAKIKPAVNQIQLNPYTLTTHSSLLSYASSQNIIIEAYSPLASLTHYPGGPVDVPVTKAAKRRGCTEAQVLLRWIRQKGAVVVTTTSKKERCDEYLEDIEPLTEEEVADIDAAGKAGPPSDELTPARLIEDLPFGTIPLNDGHKIPGIAFGTGSEHFGKDSAVYVEQALESGFMHVDTAQIYRNEESVGEALRESGLAREEVYVTSKYYTGDIGWAVRESLGKLGLKFLDLYLIHFPTSVKDIEVAWKEMEKVRDEGLAKSIGVSNFNLEQLQTVVKSSRVKPAVNQIRLHPYNYEENKSLLEYAKKHGIVIEAYSSLIPITKNPGGELEKVLATLARRRKATPAQVLFAWVRSKGAVVVTTSSRKERLEEYLGAAEIDPLSEDEIEAIEAAGAKGPPKVFKMMSREILVVATLMLLFSVHRLGCTSFVAQ